MVKVVKVRLPDATAARLQEFARQTGRSVSKTGALAIEEGLRQDEFPGIEFRDFQGERIACLIGRVQIWQVIAVARQQNLDPEKAAAQVELPVPHVQLALSYYATYPEEIDKILAENRVVTLDDA